MQKSKRKPNRLNGFDYSENGAYFVTLCIKDRKPVLSDIIVGANCVRLTDEGKIVESEIEKFNMIYDSVFVDNYVIMPNHIHLLIRIESDGRTQFAPTLSRVIKQFKGAVTKKLGRSIWQKSFYDHIIRDENDFLVRWQYIDDNPVKWAEDELYINSGN